MNMMEGENDSIKIDYSIINDIITRRNTARIRFIYKTIMMINVNSKRKPKQDSN